jgi:hypothetical protein
MTSSGVSYELEIKKLTEEYNYALANFKTALTKFKNADVALRSVIKPKNYPENNAENYFDDYYYGDGLSESNTSPATIPDVDNHIIDCELSTLNVEALSAAESNLYAAPKQTINSNKFCIGYLTMNKCMYTNNGLCMYPHINFNDLTEIKQNFFLRIINKTLILESTPYTHPIYEAAKQKYISEIIKMENKSLTRIPLNTYSLPCNWLRDYENEKQRERIHDCDLKREHIHDHERSRERERSQEREPIRDREHNRERELIRDRGRSREREPIRDRERSRERSREREPIRNRERSREREPIRNRERSRERERDRSRERDSNYDNRYYRENSRMSESSYKYRHDYKNG